MNDASLWKRLLSGEVPISDAQRETLARVPIILDTRPMADVLVGQNFWEDFNWLSIPFNAFWIEGAYPWQMSLRDTRLRVGRYGALALFNGSQLFCSFFSESNILVRVGGGSVRLNESFGPVLDAENGMSLALEPGLPEISFRTIASMFGAVFEVLQLLGCKNVSLEPVDARPVSRLGAKRHGGVPTPGYRYHVLTVRAAGSKPGTPGVDLGSMPRHVCRGHFAEYGPDFNKGLLFGKYAGRFFVPPHLKGDAKSGVVDKDYSVGGGSRPGATS